MYFNFILTELSTTSILIIVNEKQCIHV